VLSKIFMDAAPEVCAQMGTGMTGGLVDREIGRDGERRRYAAQPETAPAVCLQEAEPAAMGGG
jgi:hypothetical protein